MENRTLDLFHALYLVSRLRRSLTFAKRRVDADSVFVDVHSGSLRPWVVERQPRCHPIPEGADGRQEELTKRGDGALFYGSDRNRWVGHRKQRPHPAPRTDPGCASVAYVEMALASPALSALAGPAGHMMAGR